MEQKFTALEWAAIQGGHEMPTPVIPQFSFLTELVEARMYRGNDTLAGKKAKSLANVVFLMFMMLEILRHEDKAFAKKYARETMWYDDFSGMKGTASDLHNLLAVLSNQTDYNHKIETEPTISVPLLQIRRYLRDIENDRKQTSIDRAFFKTLGEFLKISIPNVTTMRINIADWPNCSKTEKRNIRLEIKNALGAANYHNDLLTYFRTLSEDF